MTALPDRPICRLRSASRALAALLTLGSLTLGGSSGLSPALFADDGDGDPGFGNAGLAVPGTGWGKSVKVRADGSLRIGVNQSNNVGVLAIKADGSVNTSFGVGGWRVVAPYPGGGNYDNAIALFERPNGKLLLVAQADDDIDSRPVLIQLTAGGSLDSTFGTGGIKAIYYGSHEVAVWDAALQSDGKVVLVGSCNECLPTGTFASFAARFLEDGSVDSDFGTNGWKPFDADEIAHQYSSARAVAIDGAGRIVLGGMSGFGEDERPYIGRIRATGTLDTTFSSNGLQTLLEEPLQSVTAIAIDPERKTILAAMSEAESSYPSPGRSTTLARLTDSGAVDTGWSGDGYFSLDLEEGTTVSQLLVQSNGRVVAIGGMNANGDAWSGFFLARFLSAGVLDASFDGNGLKRVEFDLETDGHDVALAAALSGGRIIAVGTAASAAGYQVALYRSQSTLVFEDGFERGSSTGWLGN